MPFRPDLANTHTYTAAAPGDLGVVGVVLAAAGHQAQCHDQCQQQGDELLSMGYTFHYRYHRKGYAYEALTALIELLHERYPSWAFVCFTEPENVSSMALLKKLGYEDMGYLPDIGSQVFIKWTTPAVGANLARTVSGRR